MPQIQAGETFVTGQQFTATRANNHVNGAQLLPGAISEQSSGSAIIQASPTPSTEVELLGRSVTTGNLVKVNIEDLTYNLSYLNIHGLLTASSVAGAHHITGESLIDCVSGSGTSQLFTSTGGYQLSTVDTSTSEATVINGNLAGEVSIEATTSVSIDAPEIFTNNAELKIGQNGKIMYEDPLVAGTYIDATERITDRRRLYDVVINEVDKVHIVANSGNRYANYTTLRDLPSSVKKTFTYVVPEGEKWIIEYDALLNYETNDVFAVMYTVNDVVNYYVQSGGASNVLLNDRIAWINFVKHRIVLTEGTHTVKFKVGFYGGSGDDYLMIFGRLGFNPALMDNTTGYATAHPYRWSETINKFKI